MGIQNYCRLTELRGNDHVAVFTTEAADGRRGVTALLCTLEEFIELERVATSRPFGINQTHQVWLRGLRIAPTSSSGCCLRVESDGGRIEHWIDVSQTTLAGLEFIFNQFALDPEIVPDMPPCVRVI